MPVDADCGAGRPLAVPDLYAVLRGTGTEAFRASLGICGALPAVPRRVQAPGAECVRSGAAGVAAGPRLKGLRCAKGAAAPGSGVRVVRGVAE